LPDIYCFSTEKTAKRRQRSTPVLLPQLTLSLKDATGCKCTLMMQSIQPSLFPVYLQMAAKKRITAAAVTPQLLAYVPVPPPCRVANGRMLFLALLPDIMQKIYPDWQNMPLQIQADDIFSGCAALRLAEMNDKIMPHGKHKNELQEVLYQKYGYIPQPSLQANAISPIRLFDAWQTICIQDALLPPCCAEAVLLHRKNEPVYSMAYLKQLRKQATACSIYII